LKTPKTPKFWPTGTYLERGFFSPARQFPARSPFSPVGIGTEETSFLASNDGRFIRGIELFVDGGMASV